jgi:hypothetical protein
MQTKRPRRSRESGAAAMQTKRPRRSRESGPAAMQTKRPRRSRESGPAAHIQTCVFPTRQPAHHPTRSPAVARHSEWTMQWPIAKNTRRAQRQFALLRRSACNSMSLASRASPTAASIQSIRVRSQSADKPKQLPHPHRLAPRCPQTRSGCHAIASM